MPGRDEILHEAEWRKCRGTGPTDWEACLHFLTTYVKIRHPERGRITFDLREAQIESLEAWLTRRFVVVLKARQIGWSTLAACMSLWLTMFHDDKYVIMLSKTEREAEKLFAKAGYAHKFLPEWMKARGPGIVRQTLQKLSFDNESAMECLPSTQDPARGESAYLIIVDEWASLENPDEAWASISPAADVGGRIIGLSTAKGSGNFFHRFWQQATNGGRFMPLFFPWSANSDRDETWYEDTAEDYRMTPWIMHQEYPRTPEEAFIKSGRSVFDVDALSKQERMAAHRGQLWAATEESRAIEFHSHPEGELFMYEAPTIGSVYTIGADVAEGLEHGDYSSAHVLDVTTDCVVAHWHGHVDPDIFGYVLYRLGFFYNTALVGVESNNHGLTTLTSLRNLRYPRIFYRKELDSRGRKQGRRMGWSTQINTKGYLIDGLVLALRGKREVTEFGIEWVGGMEVRDERTLSELTTYVREADGRKMHGSPHDDRVMSLAIAQEMTRHAHAPEYQSVEDHGWGTGDWWETHLQAKQYDDGDAWVIGENSVSSL